MEDQIAYLGRVLPMWEVGLDWSPGATDPAIDEIGLGPRTKVRRRHEPSKASSRSSAMTSSVTRRPGPDSSPSVTTDGPTFSTISYWTGLVSAFVGLCHLTV